ncbi:MAG: zinc-dependent alcohol dehydrogenase [Parvibaculaceae bacterium]
MATTDALVRPIAVSVCDADVLYLRGKLALRDPFCFGHEFVAEIVSLGEDVTGFAPGDRVVVAFLIACGSCKSCLRGFPTACTTVNAKAAYGFGIFGDWGGALSDMVRVPYANYMMARLPDGVSPTIAASVGDNLSDAYRCVAEGLREEPGTSVLVVAGRGGAPSISLYAVAMAKALGSEQVDYLDIDPTRLAIAEALGARAIEAPVATHRHGSYYVTADTSGDPSGAWLSTALRSTAPYGRCTSCGVYLKPAELPLGTMYDQGVRLTLGWANVQAHIPHVLKILEAAPQMLAPVHTIALWGDAIEALALPPAKLILARPEAL